MKVIKVLIGKMGILCSYVNDYNFLGIFGFSIIECFLHN